jgi:hypothetical protein
MAQC